MAEQAAVGEVQVGIGESVQYTRPKPPGNIRKTLNGIVSLVESIEQRKYIIPQYPTYFVNLLHIKLQDNERELDAFIELKPNEQQPSIPGDIFVEYGFLSSGTCTLCYCMHISIMIYNFIFDEPFICIHSSFVLLFAAG